MAPSAPRSSAFSVSISSSASSKSYTWELLRILAGFSDLGSGEYLSEAFQGQSQGTWSSSQEWCTLTPFEATNESGFARDLCYTVYGTAEASQ